MHQHRDNTQRMNIVRINPHIDSKRRQALKDLKDLSLVGVGGLLGFKALQDSKIYIDSMESSDSLESQLEQSTQALESTTSNMDSSNIPSHILSLPLKYFNIPQEYSTILESSLTQNQRANLTYIIPFIPSKDFSHAMPSLYHSYNVENANTHTIYNHTSKFLKHHYSTLGSLLRDLESIGFVAREYRALSQDSINPTQSLTQEIMQNLIIDTTSHISIDNILKYQVPKGSGLYKEFKALEEEDNISAIDAYNEALEILNDYKEYYFTSTPIRNAQGKILSYKDDKNKARRLMQCLDIIGQNNIRALYVGVNDKKPNNGNNHTPTLLANAVSKKNSNQLRQENIKRPKFIGRLATTIIVEDGLWLG